MAPLSFVLVNQSTVTDAQYGGALTDALLGQIAEAVMQQIQTDVSPYWGAAGTTIRVGKPDGSDVLPTEVACFIQDTLANAPGAAAYHAVLPNGAPVAYFAREDNDSILSGPQALSVDVSHELLETIGDPGANRWADYGDLSMSKALELCDPVQNVCYPVSVAAGTVSVSDFLLPSAFDPGAAGPWDFKGVAPSQDDYSNGYMIVRQAMQASDVTGKLGVRVLGTPKRTQKRVHHSSRFNRRILKAVHACVGAPVKRTFLTDDKGKRMGVIRPRDPTLALRLAREALAAPREKQGALFDAIPKKVEEQGGFYTLRGWLGRAVVLKNPRARAAAEKTRVPPLCILDEKGAFLEHVVPGDSFIDPDEWKKV